MTSETILLLALCWVALAIDVRHLLRLKIAESLLNMILKRRCLVIDRAITVGVIIVGFAKCFVGKVISYMARLDFKN
jgi:hypothetical protein